MTDIDVFITTYNRKNRLNQVINSVLNQTFENFDLYILDNCSTDGTKQLVDTIIDDRLHYIRHERNLGGIANINYALNNGKSKYVVVFHDDDLMHDNFLENEIKFLDEHVDYDAVASLSDIKDERSNKYKRIVNSNGFDTLTGDNAIIKYLYEQYHLIFPSIMYRNTSIQKYQMILESDAGPCADVNMYTKAMLKGAKFGVLHKGLMETVIHDDQDSTTNFGTMIIMLFKHWYFDELLKPILDNHQDGQKKIFKWFISKEYRRVASKSITALQAQNEINELKRFVKFNQMDIAIANILLPLEEKAMPITNEMYKICKKVFQ